MMGMDGVRERKVSWSCVVTKEYPGLAACWGIQPLGCEESNLRQSAAVLELEPDPVGQWREGTFPG